jgi:hypothetical protein
MGGSKTEVVQAAPAPSTSDSMAEYVKSLPALYQAQMQYNPQLVEQELGLLQQYGLPFAQAYKQANDALYPETAQLQEQLAGQASAGIEAGVPEAQRKMYQDQIRANLGTNAGSGVGADYTSRQMVNQQQQYQNYYRDLGLSLAGRQPLASAGVSGQANWMQGYTPQQALNYGASTYGSWAGSMQAGQSQSPWATLAGGAMGMTGQILGGMAQGGTGFFSSQRYKKNIRLWE